MNESAERQNTRNQEDSALIKAFRNGDKSAFDKLVLKYKDNVFNLCYRFLGNYEEADDYAQETFIKVYRGLAGFRFESAFSTWLYRVTVNTCKNRLSSLEFRHSKKMIAIDGGRDNEDCRKTNTIDIKDDSPSPKAALERKEKEILIQQTIESLPPDQRMIILLRDIEGLSYAEMAEISGYKIGTVKSRLARARQALAEKLRSAI
ncbi:MAG: sigma-70 family RNA polymerase sigma factor [Candidatus Omnitrophica bacterium]|nr:sigma-70 family RNA polymerase sigma factor [Candidatus Omnitrophota bacterium]